MLIYKNMNKRNFKVSSYEAYTTGKTSSGEQIIMGLLCPFITIIIFDANGKYLETKQELWEYPAPKMGMDGPYQIYNKGFVKNLDQQIKNIQTNIAFIEGTVSIEEFESDVVESALYIMPNHLDEIDLEDEDSAYLIEEKESWINSKSHCFLWAEEYWLSVDGEMESS